MINENRLVEDLQYGEINSQIEHENDICISGNISIPKYIKKILKKVKKHKFNSKTTSSQEDERKEKTKSLNTKYKDDVTYNMASKNLSMRTVDLLQPKNSNTENPVPDASEVEGEEVDPIRKEQESNEAKLVRLYNLRKKENK